VAVRDNSRINFVAPEHFERLALGTIIDAGETGAKTQVGAGYALDEPPLRTAVPSRSCW
jgi:hypothetical protein